MRHYFRLLLISALSWGFIQPGKTAAPSARPREIVPGRARATIEMDKPQYFLGENMLAHYCVQNWGQTPFRISMGGDYQGASRATRFKVTATDAYGKVVPDPDPSGFNMGGIEAMPALKPGQIFYSSIALNRYCRFDAPGIYTIRVHHDLGWPRGSKVPVAAITIKLLMPNQQQARAIVARMVSLPDDPETMMGEKAKPYADFSALHYPIYLPLLKERVKANPERILRGIGSIATPEATQTLIQLMDDPDPKLALQAAATLNSRLPDPEWSGKLGSRSPFKDPSAAIRHEFAQKSWRPAFVQPVRAHAIKLLQDRATHPQTLGAYMLQCVGMPQDIPIVLRALNSTIQASKSLPVTQYGYLNPPGACGELLRAAQMLTQRGAAVPAQPQTPGEIAVFLTALANQKDFRPTEWEDKCRAWLGSDIPYLRQLTLKSLPAPIPPSIIAALPARLRDSNLGVQVDACEVAAKTHAPELLPPVLSVLAAGKAPDEHFDDRQWLLDNANNAAAALDGEADALKIWADRMAEPGMIVPAINALADVVKDRGGYGWNGRPTAADVKAMQQRWQAFINEHYTEIKAGKRFVPGDPALSPGLFPKEFKLSVKGHDWP